MDLLVYKVVQYKESDMPSDQNRTWYELKK